MHVYRKFEFLSDNRKFIFWSLAISVAVLICLYWFFIGKAVYQVAERQKVDRNIETVSSRIAELESRYIAAASEVTIEKSFELGFVEPQSVIYIGKKSLREVALKHNGF